LSSQSATVSGLSGCSEDRMGLFKRKDLFLEVYELLKWLP